jgi:ribose-phosphate pyrophosphokinase
MDVGARTAKEVTRVSHGMAKTELRLFTGSAHPLLAQEIAEFLCVPMGQARLHRFADTEVSFQIDENIRGMDVFIVQPTSRPVDEHLMELCIMMDAFRRSSAARITAVIPYYGYARQDRKDKPRVPISAKLVANLVVAAGADRVLTMDLHAGQIQGFFGIPVDHMTALPIFSQHFRDLGLTGDRVVSVAPDAGRAKMGVKFAQMVESDFAIMHKTRPAHDVAAVTEVTGSVRGKVALVGDDVIMTGGTLLAGARALREAGATKVYVCATHGVFAKDSLERFRDADEIDQLLVTDTIPLDPTQRPPNMTVLTVSGLLAETIMNVFADESVSAIFQGENQLF